MTESQSIRYWFALIISTILSIIVALAIIALCKYIFRILSESVAVIDY